jgi:hypothetical protein
MTRKQVEECVRAARELGIREAPDSFYQNAAYTISFGNRFSPRSTGEGGSAPTDMASPARGEADNVGEK